MQIYISPTPGDYGLVESLYHCIEQISDWMQQYFLQLNRCRTNEIVFGPWKERQSVSSHLDSLSLEAKSQARNLGVILDSDLNFHSCIQSITSFAFYHLKHISDWGIMSKRDLVRLIHAFISSRLNYCIGLLTRLSKWAVWQLQRILNAAAKNEEIRPHYFGSKILTLATCKELIKNVSAYVQASLWLTA